MFTGIVRDLGTVAKSERNGDILSFGIRTRLDCANWQNGASIAIDGVCQTLVRQSESTLYFEAVRETLEKTTLGQLKAGDAVHIEPALALSDPLDGHLVSGHVDGKGKIIKVDRKEGHYLLRFEIPAELEQYLLEKGSISLSGVSLTIFNVEKNKATVSLIPETLNRTHLGKLKVGSHLNIEVDLIGKWIEKLLSKNTTQNSEQNSGGLLEKLKESGF